ncbi:MAG: hypothetical protein HON68_10325 [Gammaproteobacteria bacterium]|jgi:hemerythrin|nr:hypothetical protein [Gammaproteobacteria bacterium]MBT3489613.1 hypothetical protein [Gammaproteobacteria bacterium]MBT3719097.1 hypothetical protein [Gammaproteobacteria bacterium]MBT3843950.1 hypothetical protein [Gammaproteobacteria bacterium]MBT3893426.1 hypothetical protein [Gammaproteobacteria bacterium]
MERILWDAKKFSVGYTLMDAQHQQIVEMINGLIDLSETEFTVQEALHAYVKISQLVVKHFGAEEAILRLEGTDFLEEHTKSHDLFSDQLADRLAHCNGLGLEDSIKFLANWWVAHILNEDMKYKPLFTDI